MRLLMPYLTQKSSRERGRCSSCKQKELPNATPLGEKVSSEVVQRALLPLALPQEQVWIWSLLSSSSSCLSSSLSWESPRRSSTRYARSTWLRTEFQSEASLCPCLFQVTPLVNRIATSERGARKKGDVLLTACGPTWLALACLLLFLFSFLTSSIFRVAALSLSACLSSTPDFLGEMVSRRPLSFPPSSSRTLTRFDIRLSSSSCTSSTTSSSSPNPPGIPIRL